MSEEGMAEAIATTGLFLNFIAVIALAVCLASCGASHVTTAAMAGAVALVSFGASIACFRAQAEDAEDIAVS
jgi:uncharacterized protein (UPF0212 family)